MIPDLIHQLFQVRYIHEILHLLSGCVGSFLGTWTYFLISRKRRIKKRTSERSDSNCDS